MAHAGGRPRIYEDPAIVDKIVDEYIASGERTLTGLIIKLGFCSKDTFYQYAKKPEFSDSIRKGLLHIENEYEKKAMTQYSAGPIFALKNMGWSDKSELKVEGSVPITWNVYENSDGRLPPVTTTDDSKT